MDEGNVNDDMEGILVDESEDEGSLVLYNSDL